MPVITFSHYEKQDGATCLSSETEIFIVLLCQLCSIHYRTVQIKNCLKSTSVIKVATMKIRMISITQRKPSRAITQWMLLQSAKMNRTQRRTLVSPWRMHCTYCDMPKGTSRSEVTSNSKNQAGSLSCYQVTPVWRHQLIG